MLTGATAPASSPFCAPQRNPRPRDFDQVVVPRFGRTVARRVRRGEIGPTMMTAATAIDRLRVASREVITRVVSHNPDSLWVFVRHGILVGFMAMIMFNEEGLEALLEDRVNVQDPALEHLAAPGDAVAAIYFWAMASPAIAADGIAKVIMRLQAPPYRRADLYTYPATADGLRFARAFGFEPIPGHPRNLLRYIRQINREHQFGD